MYCNPQYFFHSHSPFEARNSAKQETARKFTYAKESVKPVLSNFLPSYLMMETEPFSETCDLVKTTMGIFQKMIMLRFQIFMAASVKITVFWNFATGLKALTMEAVSTSETSLNFYQSTRRNDPEDNLFQKLFMTTRFRF
jgi:hypothetical protein